MTEPGEMAVSDAAAGRRSPDQVTGISIDVASGSVLGAAAVAQVRAAVAASTSVNTKAAYRSDWARFTGWAASAGTCWDAPRMPTNGRLIVIQSADGIREGAAWSASSA